MDKYEAVRYGFEIASYIATCLTTISIFIGLVVVLKNKFTTKNFSISFKCYHNSDHGWYLETLAEIDFFNFTDKNFFIIECFLLIGNKRYQMEEYYRAFGNSGLIERRPIKNIPIAAFQSET